MENSFFVLEAVHGLRSSSSEEDSPFIRDLGRRALLTSKEQATNGGISASKDEPREIIFRLEMSEIKPQRQPLICDAYDCYWFICKARLEDLGVKPKAPRALKPPVTVSVTLNCSGLLRTRRAHVARATSHLSLLPDSRLQERPRRQDPFPPRWLLQA